MKVKSTRLGVLSASVSVFCLAAMGAGAQAPVPMTAKATSASDPAPPATAPVTPAAVPPVMSTGNIVVTAARLNAARESIQPSVGASSYTMNTQAIQAIPGGENAQLNQVILQAPGVTQDSFGQLHIRDDHNGVQYRLNGVILPEGVSVFSQSISPRIIQKVELLTGALPAQYGLLTAGIVNITTKSGVFDNGGSVSLYGGSHGEYEPSFTYGGSASGTNFFVSGSFLRNQLGIESPDGSSTPHHDRTDQATGFAYLDRTLGDSDRLSLIVGLSNQRFQIPDTQGLAPGLGFTVGGQTAVPSLSLSANQLETTDYAIASLLHAAERWSGQLSVFARYSTLTYRPSSGPGELLFNGIAQSASKDDAAVGLQAEGAYHLNATNTVRAGVILQDDHATSQTLSSVLQLDPLGRQVSPAPLVIPDSSAKSQHLYSFYVQNEWKALQSLTVNYGLRFDEVNAYVDEGQISPRLNTVWTPLKGTTVHVGYSRYFTPPPFELVGGETLSKFTGTSAAPAVLQDASPRSERADYYDVGVEQKVGAHLTLGADVYDRYSRHLLDEGQFGAPIILTPFNYAEGRIRGIELTANYVAGPLSVYGNIAWARAQAKSIESSQFNFDPQELAYIARNAIFLDHDQTFTGSAGVSYRLGEIRLSADLLYGSGLRGEKDLPDGSVIPNGDALAPYTQVNTSISRAFKLAALGAVELRFDVINLLDKRYEIRNGTGVGVGAPQYGPRRGLFAGVTKTF